MKIIKFEDSGLLGYDTMLLGEWFLVSSWSLEMKTLCTLKMMESSHPEQCYIPHDLSPQILHSLVFSIPFYCW